MKFQLEHAIMSVTVKIILLALSLTISFADKTQYFIHLSFNSVLQLINGAFRVKAFRIILFSLTFKDLIHACLVKTSITHDKSLTFLLLEDNDHILAKSTAQKMSLNLA